jgi:heme exporter protein D
MMFGKYAAYIIPAYAISAAVIIGLIVWTRLQYRQRLKEIAALEERGVRRRADQKAGTGNG